MTKQITKLLVTLIFAGWALGAHAVSVGVDIEAGQGSPTNWTSYTIADVDAPVTNLVAEDGSITSIGFQLDGVVSVQNQSPIDGSVIPSHPNDLTTVCCDLLYGGPDPTLATWSGLEPLATYNYWVFVSSTAVDVITATGSTVDVFDSPDISANTQAINGVLGDSTQTFASYARQIVASETGTVVIGIDSTGTPTPSGYAIELVSSEVASHPIPTMSVYGLVLMLLGLLWVASRRLRTSTKLD